MEKAKIVLLITDINEDTLDITRDNLVSRGHIITAEAKTLDSCVDKIVAIFLGGLSCDLIVLSGHSSTGPYISRDDQVIYSRYYDYGLVTPIVDYTENKIDKQGIDTIPQRLEIGNNPTRLLEIIAKL